MLFNSQLFVFVFLPIVLIGYYGLHKFRMHTGAKVLLLLSSFLFYGYYNPKYIILLWGSIAGNYLIYRLYGIFSPKEAGNRVTRKVLTAIGVSANLLLLFYFKYYNFFIDNVNAVFGTDIGLRNIILPLGISFFTFQQISFIVDSYREETSKYSLLDYSVFVSFFPQLVAGPIVLHKQLIPQLSEKKRWRPDAETMAAGLKYFITGLFKKTMIADRFGKVVTLGYTVPINWSSPEAAFIILAYTLQIYFDFSGYSDMAIGLGKLFGIDIPVNFDSPYKAVNIADFWKRWHMTMTGFFTTYVYIPLGGNRKGKLLTYINVMIVFTLSGLWHGASWSFVLWGMLHGAALVFHRIFKRYIEKIPKAVTGSATFVFVNLAWVLFRAEKIQHAKRMIKCLLTGGLFGSSLDLCYAFLGKNLKYIFENITYGNAVFDRIALFTTIAGIITGMLIVFAAPSSHQIASDTKIRRGEGIVWGFLAVLCIMTFTNVSTFLYFNF